VEIGRRRAHPEMSHLPASDSGFVGHVGERAVAVVAIESVLDRSFRRKEVRRAAVDEVNVEPPIIVVIEEQPAAAAGFGQMTRLRTSIVVRPGYTAGLRHVRKGHGLRRRSVLRLWNG